VADKHGDRVETILGVGTHLTGTLQVKGALRIDGKAEGKIEAAGDVVIGENSVVESSIQGRNVKVAGVVKGDIKASGTLEVAASGRVFGDVTVSKLNINDGAVFQGTCNMNAEPDKIDARGKAR
jgi:cytoskeletal protein CcmA (bactofilin family)